MPDLNPYGDPTLGAMAQPLPVNPAATPQDKEQYRVGWLEALQNPAVRAGLLQFGLQAMQPVPIQQTGGGAFANAVGAGVGAYNRNIDAQTAAEQRNIENAAKQQQLDTQARGVTAQETQNQQQYDLGLKGLDVKERTAAQALQNRLEVQRVANASKADVLERSKLATAFENHSLFHPGEPFDAQAVLDAMRAGVEPGVDGSITSPVPGAAEPPLHPGGPGEPPTQTLPGAKVPTITTQEQYNNLDSGTVYKDSKGRIGTKP